MNVLDINNLSFAYEDLRDHSKHRVLNGVSFQVAEGENVGLIGANGVGKSTLLKLLCGLLDMQEGNVEVVGFPLRKDNLKTIRQLLGYVFQDSDSQLFMSTIYEDVAFAPRNYGKSREEVDRCVMQALQQVHLDVKKDKPIYQLSGGEKKLASIATVLAMPTKLMLLDEPSVALDPRNRRNLINVLNQLPVAKLIASHDLDFIHATCSKVVLLSQDGSVCIHPASVLLNNQALLEQHGLELPLSFSR